MRTGDFCLQQISRNRSFILQLSKHLQKLSEHPLLATRVIACAQFPKSSESISIDLGKKERGL
jgi:hypothetical protein